MSVLVAVVCPLLVDNVKHAKAVKQTYIWNNKKTQTKLIYFCCTDVNIVRNT